MTNIIPKKVPVTVVVGKPIDCPKIADPSRAEVQKHLDIYTSALKDLYNAHKDKYNAVPKGELDVI